MGTCNIYSRDAGNGHMHHDTCVVELNCRLKAGMCVACNDAESGDNDDYLCDACDAEYSPRYLGYPGGGV